MPETGSGWGRLFLDPAKYHDDLRLLRRAIRLRWDITNEFKQVCLARLQKIIEHGESDGLAIEAIAEGRQLMAQNQKDEHKVIDVHVSAKLIELDGIASDLGIEISAIEDAQRKAGGSTGRVKVAGNESPGD